LLIEEKHLLALDKIFDDFVEDRGNEEVDASSTHPKSSNRHKRSVTIYLTAGRTVKSDHFADAIKQPHLSTEDPLGFRAHLEFGRLNASVSLTKLVQNVVQPISPTQFRVLQEPSDLVFNVEPSDHRSAPELFGALQNWAADFAPPASLRAWARYRPGFIIVLLLWLGVGGLLPILPIPGNLYTAYGGEARKILSEGVNENNQRRAIEIILAIDSHNLPESEGSSWTPGKTYWARYVFGAAILIMLSSCPSVVIGIWKGKQSLHRWRLWMRLIVGAVPGTLFLTVVWPRLLAMLGL
jgi:hypothetical protein